MRTPSKFTELTCSAGLENERKQVAYDFSVASDFLSSKLLNELHNAVKQCLKKLQSGISFDTRPKIALSV